MRIPRLTFYLLFSASCCLNNALQTAPNKKNKNLHHRRAPKEKPNSLGFVVGGVAVVAVGVAGGYYYYKSQPNTEEPGGGTSSSVGHTNLQKASREYVRDLIFSSNAKQPGMKSTSIAMPVAWGECAKVHNGNSDRKFKSNPNIYMAQLLNNAQDHITEDLACLGPKEKYVVQAGKGMGPVEAYNQEIDRKNLSKSLKFENLQIGKDEAVGLAGFQLAVKYKQGAFDKISNPIDFYNQAGEKVGQVTNLFGTQKGSEKEYYENVSVLDYQAAQTPQDKKMFIELQLKDKDYTLFMYTQNYTEEKIKTIIESSEYSLSAREMGEVDTFIAPCIDISVVDDFRDQNILLQDGKTQVKLCTAIDFKMNEKGAKATAKAAVYTKESYNPNQDTPKPREFIFNVPYYIDIYATEALNKNQINLPLLSVKVDNPCLAADSSS